MKEDGGLPNVAPFDVFEIAWTLWNLSFIPDLRNNEKLQRHIDFLSNAWQPKRGVGFAADYSVKDSDDTSLVYDTLLRFGVEKDLASVLIYEEQDYFRCFDLEANPSASVNIHVLGALGQSGLNGTNSSVQKVLQFLRKMKGQNPYWVDKWHIFTLLHNLTRDHCLRRAGKGIGGRRCTMDSGDTEYRWLMGYLHADSGGDSLCYPGSLGLEREGCPRAKRRLTGWSTLADGTYGSTLLLPYGSGNVCIAPAL